MDQNYIITGLFTITDMVNMNVVLGIICIGSKQVKNQMVYYHHKLFQMSLIYPDGLEQ